MTKTAPMPDWLIRRLDEAGYIDARLQASRKARALPCPRCGQPLLRGLDADICARTVDTDPYPLAAESEALALLMHIRTFELRWYGDHYELDSRDRWRIAGRPATRPDVDVLAEHRCGQPTLPRRTGALRTGRPTRTVLPDECPY
jgi:hypothetical protein